MLLAADLRYAFRMLTRKPGFALLAIATLALGIGACTAIFSAVYRLHFQPLPYPDAERLVNLARTREGEGFFLSPTPLMVEAWQKQAATFEHVVMIAHVEENLLGEGDPVALEGARISAALPRMLRQRPLLGRMFTAAEAAEEAPVVVLSESLWRTRFGGDRAVLGRSIRLGDTERTVIGVMPERFARYSDPMPRQQYWRPYRRSEADHFGSAMGLLKPDVTLAAASAELERIAAEVSEAAPPGEWDYVAVRLVDMLGEGTRRALPILLGAVGFVLLIACANVAGLTIVRLNGRSREIAVRAALGAGRQRILAGFAAEQVLLAVGAGGAGLLLAVWGMALIGHYAPNALPLLDTLALDPAVLLFALALLLVSTLLAGVLPAWYVLRRELADTLRGAGRVTTGTHTRSVLVTGQIALSVLLLVGAGLLIRTFATLESRDLGFTTENALALELSLPAERYPEGRGRAFFEELLPAVRALPGVTAAAVGGATPPSLGLLFGTLSVAESDVATEGISYVAGTGAAPGFLPALGARFLGGRDFAATDRDMSVVIVNRSFVERFWPGSDGVGRRIRLTSGPDAPWIEIVGVIEDIRGSSHSSTDADLQVFYPHDASTQAHALLVRTDGKDPLALLPALRQVIARADPALPLKNAATLEQRMADSISRQRFNMVLLSVFGALALALSAIGLYGLVAFTVQQRVREIGIRAALGANAASVRSLFVAQGMRLVAIGLLLGIIAAFWAVRLLGSMVAGVPLYDGVSFGAAVALIAPAALLASWIPARRAARIDPMITLKSE
jgi:predicted permease